MPAPLPAASARHSYATSPLASSAYMDSSMAAAAAATAHRHGGATATAVPASAYAAPASRSFSTPSLHTTTPLLSTSWHTSSSAISASAASAAAAASSRPTAPLSATALQDLGDAIESVLPLCALPLRTLAQLLSAPTPPPDSYATTVQAAMHVTRAARGGAAAGASAAGTATDGSGRGAGALHRLLMSLLWVLQHSPPCSAPSQSSLSVLRQLCASHPPLRPVALAGGARTVLARVALDAWNRADQAATGGAGAASARSSMAQALGVLLVLTEAPSDQALHPIVAALLNKLGAFVVAGPAAAAAATKAATRTFGSVDAGTYRGDDDGQVDSSYLLALSLLGNFVCSSSSANSFVKSNPHATTVAAGGPGLDGVASAAGAYACSTSVSSIPLKSLYRQLISCLSSPALPLVLHSLRLVAHLAVNDTSSSGGMESKLFNQANMEQTFQLVFNLIVQTAASGDTAATTSADAFVDTASDAAGAPGGGGTTLLRPAVDILATLSRSATLLASLRDYSQLQPSLKQIVRILARSVASSPHPPHSTVAGSASSTAGFACDPAHVVAETCLPLLDLLHSFAQSSSLSPAVTRLLLDEESADTLLSQLPLCSVPSVARSALGLLQRLVQQGLDGTTSAASSEERHELRTALRGALVALASSSLHNLAGALSPESFRAAAAADAAASRDAEQLELALRAPESGSGSIDYAASSAPFSRSLSSTGSFAAALPSTSSPSFSSSILSSAAAPSHRDVLVCVAHLFQTLVRDSAPLRAAVSPSIDAHELQQLVLRWMDAGDVVGSAAPHNEEVFALLHLLSLLRWDDTHEAASIGSFFRSLQSRTTDLAALAGRSLALSTEGAWGTQRRCVEDALHFLRLCTDAAVASVPRPEPHQPHQANARGETLYRAQVGAQLHQSIVALAQGIQRYNASTSRDVGRLHTSLALERSKSASLVSALGEARSVAASASQAQGERERALQARLADAEARLAQEQTRRAAEAAEAADAHAQQVAELQSRLASAENERQTHRSLHMEQTAAMEAELQAALRRAAGLEDAQREQSARFQTLAAKLKQGGQAYEAQLAYGTKLAAENAALRAEAEKQLNAQAGQLSSLTAQLGESQSLASDLTLRVEDAYAKMVLLNRALLDAQEGGQRAGRAVEEHAQRALHLSTELAALRQAHERTQAQLERRGADALALQAQLDAARAEHARENAQRDAQQAQLEARLAEVSDAERAASAQAARLDESLRSQRARTAALEQQAAVAARAAADQSARLDAAEAELQKHHQLAAMIHKLSGQATLPVPTGAASNS